MNCEHCGAKLIPGAPSCTVCGTRLSGIYVPESPIENVAMGFLGALIGALIGGASIILLSRLGYVAALSGVVTAFCTLKGYELLGKQLSKTGVILSIILLIATPFLAYNLDLVLQLHEEWKVFGLTMGDTVELLVELLQTKADLMQSYLSELGMIYLFTALGAFGIIRNALRNV